MKKLALIALLLICTAAIPWYPENGCHDSTTVSTHWVTVTNWLREPIYVNPEKKTSRILEYGVITEQLIAEINHNGKVYPVVLESRPQKSITRDYIVTISKPSNPVVDK